MNSTLYGRLTRQQMNVHYGGLTGAAKRLVVEMEADNDACLCVLPAEAAMLAKGVEQMQAAGIKFTKAAVELIAAGDQDGAAEKYGKVKGYAQVNKALGKIFDPPTLTLCQHHRPQYEKGVRGF